VKNEIAREIVEAVEKYVGKMSDMLAVVESNCAQEEIKAFRRGFGFVLSEIQDRLTDPIYREHMDLIPKEIDYVPLPGPTLAQIGEKIAQSTSTEQS